METKNQVLTINIEKVLESKSRTLAKYTPKFIINFIKRIIHVDEINYILDNNQDKSGANFATGALKDMNVSANISYVNQKAFNDSSRYIFVSNHPLGGLDGLILISELGIIFGNIKFVVNDLLMNIKPLEPIFVPVNKHGKMSKNYSELINEAYASDSQILYFPSGLCSRQINGKITDTEWKVNFLKQALKYNRDIVPIYFGGKNTPFFYRLAQLRKFLGIKFNIEMLFLPSEMFKKKNSTFDVVIGEPISIDGIKSRLEGGEKPSSLCLEIRNISYNLKERIVNSK